MHALATFAFVALTMVHSTELNGFGKFTFGMTVDEVRSLTRLPNGAGFAPFPFLDSDQKVPLSGIVYGLSFGFPGGKLRFIDLRAEVPGDEKTCGELFQKTLLTEIRKYGQAEPTFTRRNPHTNEMDWSTRIHINFTKVVVVWTSAFNGHCDNNIRYSERVNGFEY